MISADEIKTQQINNQTVETEIFLLNLNILNASQAGSSTVSVTLNSNTEVMSSTITGTPMTANPDYYDAWQIISNDVQKQREMSKVIDYYQRLGYTINRKSSNGQYLFWQISW